MDNNKIGHSKYTFSRQIFIYCGDLSRKGPFFTGSKACPPCERLLSHTDLWVSYVTICSLSSIGVGPSSSARMPSPPPPLRLPSRYCLPGALLLRGRHYSPRLPGQIVARAALE